MNRDGYMLVYFNSFLININRLSDDLIFYIQF